LEAQGLVARTIRERHAQQDPVGEEQLLDAIGVYLAGRGVGTECIAEQVRRLRYFRPGSAAPAVEEAVVRPAPADDDSDDARATLPYFVVVTRRAGIRRLHRTGGCSLQHAPGR